MANHISRLLVVPIIGFFGWGCSNSGSAPGGSSINMPQVTAPVSGASSSAVEHSLATTGLTLNAQTCAHCGSSANLTAVWNMASIFVYQGKVADLNSCIIKSLAKADVVPNLTSGNYVYMTTSSSNLKVSVSLSGGTLSSFKVFGCSGTTQNQYIGGSNTNGNVVFSGRILSSPYFVTLDATGTMSGTNWTSKSVTIGEYNGGTTPSYSQFTMTQNPSYLDITGVLDQGTLGTLDGADVRLYSRAQLIGTSVATYALGDGSVLKAIGTSSSSQTNWNGDTSVEGSGPTTYDSVVAAGTLPTIPTTRATAFATAEQWDCSTPSTAVNVQQVATSSSSLISDLSTCVGSFQ